MSKSIGKQTHVITCKIGTIAAATSDEVPIFVAPFDCVIEKVYITNAAALAAHATDYTTLDIQSKGSAGSGTDSLASFDTATGGDNISLVAFVPYSFGDLSNTEITKAEAVTLKKTDAGGGVATDEARITIVYVPQAGLKSFEN
jgi:hypothetical protein